MDIRGMGPPQQQAAAAVPSLMQMAQGEAPVMDASYAPEGVRQTWAQYAGGEQAPDGGRGGAFSGGQAQLAPWYNPANWGPPPAMDAQGRPSNAPTGGFWKASAMDDRPNTFNWRLLGDEPGNYMTMGHLISQGKRIQDMQQGQNPPAGAEGGGNWPPIRFNPPGLFGAEYPAHFKYGSTARFGIPGQMEPWATMWEGPG